LLQGGIEAHSFLPLITAELFADVQRRIGPVGVTSVATTPEVANSGVHLSQLNSKNGGDR
jgi:hypothetical protein